MKKWRPFLVTYRDSAGTVREFLNWHLDARQAAAEVRWNFDCVEIISVVERGKHGE